MNTLRLLFRIESFEAQLVVIDLGCAGRSLAVKFGGHVEGFCSVSGPARVEHR